MWKIEVREQESNPFLARIIIAGKWDGNPEEAKKLLEDVYRQWPKDKKVKFIITCGGFIQFDWPRFISRVDIGDNLDPSRKAVATLVKEAKECIRFVLSNGLDSKLKKFANYITIGIDSYKEKMSLTEPHIELVFLIDLKNKKLYSTGKSYPTSKLNQEKGLVRISDLTTHFVDLDDFGKLMLLGCHDLIIFDNRNWKGTGEWRKDIKREFRKLAREEKPLCVLQHPHTTVTIKTWRNAWNGLRRILPSVEHYAGAGTYYEPDRPVWDALDDVRKATKRGNTIDFIVIKN